MTTKFGPRAAIASAHGSVFARAHDAVASAVKRIKEGRAIRRAIYGPEELVGHALKNIGLQRGEGFEKPTRPESSLVLRLIRAKNDPAKRRVHDYLLALSDKRLKESLGLSDGDLRALRGTR